MCNFALVDFTFSVCCHINSTLSHVNFDNFDIFAQMHNAAVIFVENNDYLPNTSLLNAHL